MGRVSKLSKWQRFGIGSLGLFLIALSGYLLDDADPLERLSGFLVYVGTVLFCESKMADHPEPN